MSEHLKATAIVPPALYSPAADCSRDARHDRLLVRADAVDPDRADATLRLFDEAQAVTWRLLHPKQ